MHHAPAVRCVVGPSRWSARVLWVLWLLGCGAMGAFFTTQAVSLPIGLLWGSTVLAGAGLAWRSHRTMLRGELHWDGAAWHWSGFSGPLPCRLVLHMDWQQCLLVTVHQSGGNSVWLWLEPLRDPSMWLALRRAVVGARRAANSHAVADTPDAAQEVA